MCGRRLSNPGRVESVFVLLGDRGVLWSPSKATAPLQRLQIDSVETGPRRGGET